MRMEGNYYPRFTGENKAQERFYLAQCHIHWIIDKQGNSRETSTSALLTMPKPLTV